MSRHPIKLKNFHFAIKVVLNIKNWPTYFLDFFDLTSKKYITYKLRNGLKYVVRAKTSDRGILTTAIVNDEYELNKTKLAKDATVIDIGTQIGTFAVTVSKKASKVYCYEPMPDNFGVLKRNIKVNKLDNKFEAFNLAVSDKKKKLKIYVNPINTGGHSAFEKTGKFVEVQTTTLKSIFDDNKIKKCDLLKIDVEGSEYDVLYPLPKTYLKRIDRIRMEPDNIDDKKKNIKSMIKYLRDNGYKVKFKEPILFANRI